MQFMARRFVVAIVDELPGIVIDAIRPIAVLASCEQDHEILVHALPGNAKASHVPAAGQQVGDRLAG